MRPFFDDLYRSASRLAMNDSDAKDLVQEVCIKAFLNFDELEKMRHQRAWLLKVLYHRFVDWKRSEQRSPIRNATVIENHDELFLADKLHNQPDEQVDQKRGGDAVGKVGHEHGTAGDALARGEERFADVGTQPMLGRQDVRLD